MRRRIYSGDFTLENLSDYLMDYYNKQPERGAEKFGSSDKVLIQVNRQSKKGEIVYPIVKIALARPQAAEKEILITLNDQQAFSRKAFIPTANIAGDVSGVLGIVGVGFFDFFKYQAVWDIIDGFMIKRGGVRVELRKKKSKK